MSHPSGRQGGPIGHFGPSQPSTAASRQLRMGRKLRSHAFDLLQPDAPAAQRKRFRPTVLSTLWTSNQCKVRRTGDVQKLNQSVRRKNSYQKVSDSNVEVASQHCRMSPNDRAFGVGPQHRQRLESAGLVAGYKGAEAAFGGTGSPEEDSEPAIRGRPGIWERHGNVAFPSASRAYCDLLASNVV